MSSVAGAATWTVRSLLTWTTKYFLEKKIDAASTEARTLLAYVLGCRPIDVLTRYDEEPTDAERSRYRALIQRRLEGCPVAYLVGTRDFYLLTYEVSQAVLIPRPDTETLVEAALDVLKPTPQARILDLGTGSGCIAISLAHRMKAATVVAVDLSPDATDMAKRNAKKHGVAERMAVRVGDLFQAVQAEERFDVIVSNPPYIPPSEIETLEVGVKDFEPRLALDGGPDGLAFYRRIADGAKAFLTPSGSVLVEIGWTQDAAVRTIFAERGWHVGESRKDMAGHWRVVVAKLS